MVVNITSALNTLLRGPTPPSLLSQPSSLYVLLSRYPKDGVGQRVHQTRWGTKGIIGSYWLITRSKLKLNGTHGKAWGQLYWKERKVGKETQIPGGLKYTWALGPSRLPRPELEPETKTPLKS